MAEYDIIKYSEALKELQSKYLTEEITRFEADAKEFDEGFAKFLRLGRSSVPTFDAIPLDDSVDPLVIATAWQIADDIRAGEYTPELAAREIVYFSIFLLKVGNKEEGAVATNDNFKDNFTDVQEENFLYSWELGFSYICKAVELAALDSDTKESYIQKLKEILEKSSNATQLRIIV